MQQRGKDNNSIQLTCIESWIATHIFAKFPLYNSEVKLVIGVSQLFSMFLGGSRCLGTPWQPTLNHRKDIVIAQAYGWLPNLMPRRWPETPVLSQYELDQGPSVQTLVGFFFLLRITFSASEIHTLTFFMVASEPWPPATLHLQQFRVDNHPGVNLYMYNMALGDLLSL